MTEKRFWPDYNIPPTYRLGRPGMGCAGDPPNYPSYHVRPIWTATGNYPPWGRCPRIFYKGNGYADFEDINIDANWDKLPLGYTRVKAWIMSKFRTMQHCYLDPDIYDPDQAHTFHDSMIIYPVPDYKLETFTDDERFSDEWRHTQRKAVEIKNREIRKAAKKIAVFDNHAATIVIREFYPEFDPPEDARLKLECDPENVASWWERSAMPYPPERCPGDGNYRKHPANNSWCQFCGWTEEEGTEKEERIYKILQALEIE